MNPPVRDISVILDFYVISAHNHFAPWRIILNSRLTIWVSTVALFCVIFSLPRQPARNDRRVVNDQVTSDFLFELITSVAKKQTK